MKTQFKILLVGLTLIIGSVGASAQGTAFTYQGQLSNGGSPATGVYDFRFRLATDSLGNNLVGSTILTNAVSVNGGLFTVTMDFGAGIFNGSNYWLEVDVKTNLAGGYTVLNPLQALTPVPYAVFAGTASNLSGTVPAAQLTGNLPTGQLSGTYGSAVTLNNAGNSFSGSGAGLAGVNAAALGGLNSSNFWQLGGNNLTVGQFLGSTNNQALELDVNGVRGLRIEPNSSRSPNVIGGSYANVVGPGLAGVVIAGGGSTNIGGFMVSNAVMSSYANIGGGAGNFIDSGAGLTTIAGGVFNTIHTGTPASFIGGGSQNIIGTNADSATIGGGLGNGINTASWGSTIAGGEGNQVGVYSQESFIGSGGQNQIFSNSYQSVIVGGNLNSILNDAWQSTIGGGQNQTIGLESSLATIAGGAQNNIGSNSYQSTISGGFNNRIQDNAWNASIGGGAQNIAKMGAYDAVIGGGEENSIETNAGFAVIAGGVANVVGSNSLGSAIGGGSENVVLLNSAYATIAGGVNNTNLGNLSTIPGGDQNAAGPQSFAAGHRAKATTTGAFVWADFNEADFTATANNQFLIRASGGVGINTNNPQATLHVNGTVLATSDMTIPAANDYKYATAKTHYYSVSGMAFTPEGVAYGVGYLTGNAYISNGTATSVGYLDAAVNLPDGATVTAVTFYQVDNDGTYNLQNAQLWRNDGSASTLFGNTVQMASVPTPLSNNSTLIQVCTTSSISSPVIDNQNYAYWLRWGSQQANSSMRLAKVVIAYTVTKVD